MMTMLVVVVVLMMRMMMIVMTAVIIYIFGTSELLWRAPELLQNTARDVVGTQKGDVYAFAFILYEMIGRKGPWGQTTFSNRGSHILC